MKIKKISIKILAIFLPVIIIAISILVSLGYTASKEIINEEIDRSMDTLLNNNIGIIEKGLISHSKVAEAIANTMET